MPVVTKLEDGAGCRPDALILMHSCVWSPVHAGFGFAHDFLNYCQNGSMSRASSAAGARENWNNQRHTHTYKRFPDWRNAGRESLYRFLWRWRSVSEAGTVRSVFLGGCRFYSASRCMHLCGRTVSAAWKVLFVSLNTAQSIASHFFLFFFFFFVCCCCCCFSVFVLFRLIAACFFCCCFIFISLWFL